MGRPQLVHVTVVFRLKKVASRTSAAQSPAGRASIAANSAIPLGTLTSHVAISTSFSTRVAPFICRTCPRGNYYSLSPLTQVYRELRGTSSRTRIIGTMVIAHTAHTAHTCSLLHRMLCREFSCSRIVQGLVAFQQPANLCRPTRIVCNPVTHVRRAQHTASCDTEAARTRIRLRQ